MRYTFDIATISPDKTNDIGLEFFIILMILDFENIIQKFQSTLYLKYSGPLIISLSKLKFLKWKEFLFKFNNSKQNYKGDLIEIPAISLWLILSVTNFVNKMAFIK